MHKPEVQIGNSGLSVARRLFPEVRLFGLAPSVPTKSGSCLTSGKLHKGGQLNEGKQEIV